MAFIVSQCLCRMNHRYALLTWQNESDNKFSNNTDNAISRLNVSSLTYDLLEPNLPICDSLNHA